MALTASVTAMSTTTTADAHTTPFPRAPRLPRPRFRTGDLRLAIVTSRIGEDPAESDRPDRQNRAHST
ncbi:hypothetical protein Psi02_40740 [Planotetraspora silvatica]|uniref:Uncharacterized protein n=1 Tax=Planotetraspora silvatica TaxID=234614 RepID=A0A8J3UNK9_9ACTN|nr:hypothetical protein Psi02_40740 [Planotetraspora silvatica]